MIRLTLFLTALFISFTGAWSQPGVTSGFFALTGFTNSRLVWVETANPEEYHEICSLCCVPNRLEVYGNYLYVVRSGDFGSGEGAALVRSSLTELAAALAEQRDPQWEVLPFAPGSNPWAFTAWSEDGVEQAAVTLMGVDSVAFLDLEDFSVTGMRATGPGPEGVCRDAQSGRVFVANSGLGGGNTVTIFPDPGAAAETVVVGGNPQEILVNADGSISVLCSGSTWPPDNAGEVVLLDSTGVVSGSFPLGNNSGRFSRGPGSLVVVGDEYSTGAPPVQFYDSGAGGFTLLPQSYTVGGFALAGDENYFYVGSSLQNNVQLINAGLEVELVVELGGEVVDLAPAPTAEAVVRQDSGNGDYAAEIFVRSVVPNPFNPATWVTVQLQRSTSLTLRLYDVLGRTVRRQYLSWQSAGVHRLEVPARGLAAGRYWLSLSTAAGDNVVVPLTCLP